MKTSEALAILNLPSGSSPEEVKKAYFRLVRKFSPEKDPEQFQRIREAYELLREHGDDLKPDFSLPYPSNPGVYMLVRTAEKYRDAGKDAKAASILEQAISLAPDEPVPLFEIVQCYLASGHPQKAAVKAEQLVQLCPENALAWSVYAYALFDRGWHKKAFPAFQKTFELGFEDNSTFTVCYMQSAFFSHHLAEGEKIALDILKTERWKKEDIDIPLQALAMMAIYPELAETELSNYLNLYLNFLRKNQGVLDDIPEVMGPLFTMLDRKIEKRETTRDSYNQILPVVDEVVRLFPEAAQEAEHFRYVFLFQTIDLDPHLTLEEWKDLVYPLANDLHFSDSMLRYQTVDAQLCLLMQKDQARKELDYLRSAYPGLYSVYSDFFTSLASGDTDRLFRKLTYELEKLERKFSGGSFSQKYGIPKPSVPEYASNPFPFDIEPQTPTTREKPKVGRNDLCPCGSGKKFKRCCMGKGVYD